MAGGPGCAERKWAAAERAERCCGWDLAELEGAGERSAGGPRGPGERTAAGPVASAAAPGERGGDGAPGRVGAGASALFAGLQDLGVANGEDLKETLTNCTEPLKAIEQFQVGLREGPGAGARVKWAYPSAPRPGGPDTPSSGRFDGRRAAPSVWCYSRRGADTLLCLPLRPLGSARTPAHERQRLRSLLPPRGSNAALCFLRQRTACCCPPCSRPCRSWTCTGLRGWSSTSRFLMSFGTSCWSVCQPSLPRGRPRKGQ